MSAIKTHYSCAELAALKLPGYPGSERGFRDLVEREGWAFREASTKGGKNGMRREYQPSAAVMKLIQAREKEAPRQASLAAELAALESSPEYRAGQAIARQMAEASAREAEARQQDDEALLALFAQATGERGERGRAWLATIQCWRRFYREKFGDQKRSQEKALIAFIKAFNAGALDLDGEVYAPVLKSSGRGKNAQGKGLSLRTLKRKLGLIKKSNIGALLDNHKSPRRGDSLIHQQPRLEQYMLGLLAQQPDIAAVRLHEMAENRFAGDATIKVPSYSAVDRYVKNWKAKNASAYLHLRNPDAWKNKAMPAVGLADGDVVRLNQRWELDSTLGDLLLSDGKRHAVIGVIDVYSRRLKLLVAPTSKARAIAAVVRRAMLDWGVPEQAKTDNGADYASDYLTGIWDAFGVEHVLCPPFSPEYKPHIERALGTFNHDLVELLPGYIGHDVAERKAIEARKSFARRLMEKDGVLEVRLSPEELQKFCDDWTENRYHHRPHAGLEGETPFQRAASYRGEIRRIHNERALDILLSPPVDGKTRSLGKKGLEIHGGFYSHPELWRHHTTGDAFRVMVDETDLGRVYAYDDNGFVCVAICPERLGLPPEAVSRHAMECKRMAAQQRNQGMKTLNRAKKGVDLNAEINSYLRSKAESAGKLATFPQLSTGYTTPALEGAARAAESTDRPPRSPEAEKLSAEAKAHFAASGRSAEIIKLPKRKEHPLERMSDEEKYEFWCSLDAAVKAGGGELPDDAQVRRFYAEFPLSARFKAQAAIR